MPTQADPRLDRQSSLGLTIPPAVTIVGCGGVGSWIAYFLALAGVPRLLLWDSDTISETNLNRLPVGPSYIGMEKSHALTGFLHGIVPSCQVIPFTHWDDSLSPLGESWIVAGTDTWASRCSIHRWAIAHHIKYIESSAEGEFGGCTGAPADFAAPEETQAGYASVPVHVGPCVASAMLVCYHILHNVELGDDNWRMGWSAPTVADPALISGFSAQRNNATIS